MTLQQARAGTASGVLLAYDTSCDVAAFLLICSASHAMCMALPEDTSAVQTQHSNQVTGSCQRARRCCSYGAVAKCQE